MGNPSPETRTFSTGAVLTVVTGTVLAPVEEIHALLDYMTSDVLMTHQLGRALTECQPEMRRQHPDLAALMVPEFDGEQHARLWVATTSAAVGRTRVVRPLPEGVHVRVADPLAELAQMMDAPSCPDATREGA